VLDGLANDGEGFGQGSGHGGGSPVHQAGLRSFGELVQSPRALKAWVAGGCVAVLLAILLVGAPALVRGIVIREARARGFAADVGSVRFGLGRVWALDVRVTEPGEDFELRVSSVAVSVFSGEVTVRGGTLFGSGDPRRLSEKVRAGGGATSGGGDGQSSGRDVRLEGLYVRWLRGKETVEVFGLKASRLGGSFDFGAELARASAGTRSVEARGVVVGLADQVGQVAHRRLLRLETRALELVLRGEPSEAGVERRGSVTAPPPAAESEARGERLRELRALALPLLRDTLAEGASLTLDGVSARIERSGETLSFGPSRLVLVREQDVAQVSLTPSSTEDGVTPLALSLALPLTAGPVHVVARGGPVSLSSLGVRAGQLGLRDVERATVTADGVADFSEDLESVELNGKLSLHGLLLGRKELSAQPVGPWSFEASLQGRARLDGTELHVASSELHFGEVRAELSGTVRSGDEHRHVEGRFRIPLSGCQSVVDAMPTGLMPLVRGMKLSGSFGVDLQVRYDAQKPQDTRVALSVQNECRVLEVPPELSPRRFERPFSREVKAPDGTLMTIDGGPGTPSWVSLDDISPHMETAVLICEDGRFHSHGGFDFRALESAIKDDLKQGRFARGASTVSMQLAKNLYLGQEKTLGRKLQEALLTLLLEQQLDKRRILELYLNIVELGPGLYGVGDAAQYYFATPARALTLGQALYLASILPNPTSGHFEPDGKLSAGWQRYLRKLMHIARKRERIDDVELEAGLAEVVAFRVPGVAASPPTFDAGEPSAPPELGDDSAELGTSR
jgi:Transglycosylase